MQSTAMQADIRWLCHICASDPLNDKNTYIELNMNSAVSTLFPE